MATGVFVGDPHAAMAPFFISMKEVVREYLPQSSDEISMLLDSTGLVHLTLTSLKNLAYIGAASTLGINDPAHFLSARVDYLETAIVGLASLIHNVVMGILYTLLVGVTLGLCQSFNYGFYKHWFHTAYAAAALVSGLIGAAVPTFGAAANAGLLWFSGARLYAKYEQDIAPHEEKIIQKVRQVCVQHHDSFALVIQHWTKSLNFDRLNNIEPAIRGFEDDLGKTKKIIDLKGPIKTFVNKLTTLNRGGSTPYKK